MNRALLIALFALVAFAILAQPSAQRRPSAEQNLRQVEQQKREIRARIAVKRREAAEVAAQIRDIDARATEVDTLLDGTITELAKQQAAKRALEAELAARSLELEAKKVEIARRIRAMYMRGGDSGVLEVLVNADSLADFAARKTILERIAEADREAFDEVRAVRDQVARKKRQQDLSVIRINGLLTQRRQEQDRLEGIELEKRTVLATIQRNRQTLQREFDEMDAESRRLEAQIARAQQGTRSTRFTGRFIMPTRGRFTSGFGYRVHPVLGSRRMHNGIDLAAPTGTPIVAAAAGTVLTVGSMRGYGNTVVLDHGGGVSTLYAHCSRLLVSRGQRVRQGDRIATVGSTGLSTGPHLHFEIRINGRPVDPRPRLPF